MGPTLDTPPIVLLKSTIVRAPLVQRVLLLEDDDVFKGILTDYLTENEFRVTPVPNGVEGVRSVLDSDFDVIICDLMMPLLSGEKFFQALTAVRPHLCDRFIFMSGHQNDPSVIEFISRIKGTMLPKPFQMRDLLGAIKRLKARERRRKSSRI